MVGVTYHDGGGADGDDRWTSTICKKTLPGVVGEPSEPIPIAGCGEDYCFVYSGQAYVGDVGNRVFVGTNLSITERGWNTRGVQLADVQTPPPTYERTTCEITDYSSTPPACNDTFDNDGDRLIDMNDPGCETPEDDDETDTPQCSDLIDNDDDGDIDFGEDSDCPTPEHDDESEGEPEDPPQCDDGIDNDGNGTIDFSGGDLGCESPEDESEAEPEDPPVDECADGLDNDNDGYVDNDEDPGCANGQERDNISCGFSANPNVVAVGIGTSELKWNCLHSDGETSLHASLRVTVTPNSNEVFPDLAGEESGSGSANVSPDSSTEFFLSIFGVNFTDEEIEMERHKDPIHTEGAEVRVSTTSFDEIIP
jgi:hypothetical protein